jgi:hypothetical protein
MPAGQRWRAMASMDEFQLNPVICLDNGRMLRSVADAVALLREHETRPGVDDRDEVLHALERAGTDDERARAVERFVRWLETWGIAVPVTDRPGSTQGPERS